MTIKLRPTVVVLLGGLMIYATVLTCLSLSGLDLQTTRHLQALGFQAAVAVGWFAIIFPPSDV